MKKTLLILAAIAPLAVSAQITIVQGDLPGANTLWVQANDTGYTGAIPAGGASQVWNYATLQNQQQDSTTFTAAAGTPYASQFPGSNLTFITSNPPQYTYITSSASGFEVNGGVDPGTGTAIHFNPARLIVPVPFTYNSTITHNSRMQIDTTVTDTSGTYQMRFVQYTVQTFNGDGYGSLQLPTGTYPATLRIKETDLTTDSIYVYIGIGYFPLPGYTPVQTQTTNFSWLRNGPGALLLEIGSDSAGQQATEGATYLISSGPTGIADNLPLAVKNSYPNPSADFVTLDLINLKGEAETLYIYDITGRQIDAINIKNIDRNTFDVRHYDNGRYVMRIAGGNMQPVMSSFTVVHY